MDGLTLNDIEAIEAGSVAAGEYLESIGKTDLATMSETEWMTMGEAWVMTALDKLAALSIEQIPFPELISKVEKQWQK